MNAGKWGLLGGGALIALALAAGVVIGVGGMAVAHHDVKETAKPISAWDIVEKQGTSPLAPPFPPNDHVHGVDAPVRVGDVATRVGRKPFAVGIVITVEDD
jgi:hypothetical protein